MQDICSHFDIPKSSGFVIVQSLLELNFIATTPYNSKSYCLGVEAFTLGIKYFNDLDTVNKCITAIQPIADKYDKTAFVSVLNDTKISFVGKYVAPNAVLASCALGSRKDVYATASGKAFLAFISKEELERILNKIKFEMLTENTITSREKLMDEINLTRSRGFAIEKQEDRNVSSCCAVPIFDYTGKVILTISLSDVYNPDMDNYKMSLELKQVAADISKSFGYTAK